MRDFNQSDKIFSGNDSLISIFFGGNYCCFAVIMLGSYQVLSNYYIFTFLVTSGRLMTLV